MTLDQRVNRMIKKERKKHGIKQAIFISDVHVPYQDKKANNAVREFIREQDPDYLIYGGDILDFYTVSRFDKDPARKLDIQDEVTQGQIYMAGMNAAAPNAKKWFIEGNHEKRVRTLLMRHPELSGLNALELKNLLNLDAQGIIGIGYDDGVILHDFLFKHGSRAVKYLANAELEVEGMDGMSGHGHRIQRASKTDRKGTDTWYSVGHLSNPDQVDYIDNKVKNWQQGFGIVEFNTRNKTHEVTTPEIRGGKFQYQGRVYKGAKKQ